MPQDSSILASICGCCGLFLFSAIEPFCNTKRYGCGNCSCTGSRGCCDSCFAKGFNEDSWDKKDAAQRKAAEGEGGGEGNAKGVNKDEGKRGVNGEQPTPAAEMTIGPAPADQVADKIEIAGDEPEKR